MHRSILFYISKNICRSHLNLLKSSQNGRSCILSVAKSSSPSTTVNSFHTSFNFEAEDDNGEKDVNAKSSAGKTKRNARVVSEDDQLQSAAVEAARSLPGDWTRTADELMARLSMQEESHESGDSVKEPSATKSSLLSTMKVGRNFERTNTGRNSLRQSGRDLVQDKIAMRKRLTRKSENFTSLYSQPRLGIFDAMKLKSEGEKESTEEDNLWQTVSRERADKARGVLPRNGFEELIQWTKEGRMWSFPVNNEEDMHEERQYKFHDHVFLNRHLGDFPSDGPLRRFMDLVIIGLNKNPWISVPEKVEHIRWYADYFRQKQQLLESSIGEKAKMKQS